MGSHAIPRYPVNEPRFRPGAGLLGASRGRAVDRFLSHFTHRFDAKGRISIPAAYRQVLAKDGFAGVYAYPSLDAPALDCGGNALIAEIDALLSTMPPYSPDSATPLRRRFSA